MATLLRNTQVFLDELNGWREPAKEAINVGNISQIVQYPLLIEHALMVHCELTEHLIDTTKSWLNSLAIDQWNSILRDSSSSQFKLTCLLLKEGKLSTVPENAITVYRELLMEYARGNFHFEASAEWQVFHENAKEANLKPTAKNIRDAFISDVAIDPDKFIALSDLLLNHAELEAKSGDVVRKILAPMVNDRRCLSIMASQAENYAPIIQKAGDDAADFHDAIKQTLENSEPSEELQRFAQMIGVQTN